jgi:hypothetical protein
MLIQRPPPSSGPDLLGYVGVGNEVCNMRMFGSGPRALEFFFRRNNTMSNGFKWSLGPLAILAPILIYASYMAWNEYAINNIVVEKALSGNTHAVKILAKYEKPWTLDKRVVLGALEGNKYALEILKLTDGPPGKIPENGVGDCSKTAKGQ